MNVDKGNKRKEEYLGHTTALHFFFKIETDCCTESSNSGGNTLQWKHVFH